MSLDMFFRGPYILDFLDLKDTYSEKDLKNAIQVGHISINFIVK